MPEREELLSSSVNEGPLPKPQRQGIGLSLSGVGFRASLFHLGALRRLNELGVLHKLDTISSVSGGSIINAFLAVTLPFPLSAPVQNWEDLISKPFRKFCAQNIRRKPILKTLLPWEPNSEALGAQYESLLTRGKLISQLPSSKPLFVFCGTDLIYGVNWIFTQPRSGDYQVGYITPTPADWKLSTAVAMSSCFPPVFKPMSLNLDPKQLKNGKDKGPDRDNNVRSLTFSDGGVYDNLGLEPIWKTHKTVLCSDGGALFDSNAGKTFFWDVKRWLAIPENQALAVRKRWLISSFGDPSPNGLDGTFWGIGSAREKYKLPGGGQLSGGYSKDLATEVIGCIRTDLDAFSEVEAAVLENQGYWLADAGVWVHLPPPLRPDPYPALVLPHPEWADEQKVREALKDSWKRTLLGRG
ncbi:MAG TPA: patatin-like phospholipase family protein [Candidatus Dormibacteraeota bacterium]|nr:patatin-like phospholipase family protein [Candidatus Dormibacteraeota bacterium]